MSIQLWLQEPRQVIDEFGAGFLYSFTGDQAKVFRELRHEGYLTLQNGFHEPVGGVLMSQPSWDLDAMVASEWSTTGTWAAQAAMPLAWYHAGNATQVAAMEQQAAGAWSMESAAALGWGVPRILQWLTYTQGGAESGEQLTLTFGGNKRLRLFGSGKAELAHRVGEATTYTPVAVFDWMVARRYLPGQDQASGLHALWLYECGPLLVIRSVGHDGNGEPRGLAWVDPEAKPNPDDSDPTPQTHALRAGKWKLSGTGRITVSLTRQWFVPGETVLERPAADGLSYAGAKSTQPALVGVYGLPARPGNLAAEPPLVPVVTCYNELGTPWPQETTHDAWGGLRWKVAWTATDALSYYLRALAIKVPRTTRASGAGGTDILALPGVADKRITLTREEGDGRESLSATVFAAGSLSSHVQANMHVRYVVDGVTRFRGLTERAQRQAVYDRLTKPLERLTLTARGLWRRFDKAVWPGGFAFDGQKLRDCVAAAIEWGGLPPSEYELYDNGYVIPAPPEGEAPSCVYRAGTPISQILQDLREKFYGIRLTHYFRLSDGKFVLAPTLYAGSPSATFYGRSSLAAAAGVPGRVTLGDSLEQDISDDDLANIVVVLGQDPRGRPLLQRAVDTGSINDESAFNYVAEPRYLIVADPGLQTQGAVDYVCRSLFDLHRRPRVVAQWKSVRVDLLPNELVALSGTSQDGLYRLRSMSLESAAEGDAADPRGRASYVAERVA